MRYDSISGARFSPCGQYRYALWRNWGGDDVRYLMWLMLNPSTATWTVNDPTIRRCLGFTHDMGYTGILVGNLYGFRATNPKALRLPVDPVGPENDGCLLAMADKAEKIICAWGQPGPDKERCRVVTTKLLVNHKLYVMGWTKTGFPRHPLMLPKPTRPHIW